MNLTDLPIDAFIEHLTHLPFESVRAVCQTDRKSRSYCIDSKYNSVWKSLIDNTFDETLYYKDNLKSIWSDLNVPKDTYNYLVYTNLIKFLDPVTQLRIYYKQGDMESFNLKRFTGRQRFLAYVLLGEKEKAVKILPYDDYRRFIRMMNGDHLSQEDLDCMLIRSAADGSPLGVSIMINKGANIDKNNNEALIYASESGNLNVVKYLIEHGADVSSNYNEAFKRAVSRKHLNIVKYLVENGADISVDDNMALTYTSRFGNLNMIKYLAKNGVDLHANNNRALEWASASGKLDIVEYLVKHGANIHVNDDKVLILASGYGHLNVVKYLLEHGANVHTNDDKALISASGSGHLNVVKYLLEHGANVHAQNDGALEAAYKNGHYNVIKYLKSLSNTES